LAREREGDGLRVRLTKSPQARDMVADVNVWQGEAGREKDEDKKRDCAAVAFTVAIVERSAWEARNCQPLWERTEG
jgi:hypothetical protein